MPDYALITRKHRAFKSAVTRAKNTGDHAKVIAICQDALDFFRENGYPDDWMHFQRAADDAAFTIRFGR